MKNNKNLKLSILIIACLILYTIANVTKSFQNDTFFTINTGKYIVENGINDDEPFTFHENLKFVKIRWAFDVLIYFIFNIFSFDGLYIFTVIMSCFLVCSIYYVTSKLANMKLFGFIASILSIVICHEYYVCRAQIMSYSIFIWEIYLLNVFIKNNDKKIGILLVLLSILLLAFHSSVWILYLVFFMPFFAEGIARRFLPKKIITKLSKIQFNEINVKKLAILFTLIVITGFITPLGLSPFTYSIKSFTSVASKFVNELQPYNMIHNHVLLFIVLTYALLILLPKSKIKLYDLLLFIGGLILIVTAERNLFVVVPIILISYGQTLKNILNINNLFEKEQNVENILEKYFYYYATRSIINIYF